MTNTAMELEAATALNNFAEALNSGDAQAIYNAYSIAGLYIPPATTDIWQPVTVKERAEQFFRTKKMNIDFEVRSVFIENGYAFVNAVAKSEIISKSGNSRKVVESKDFFVLRNETGSWKILRYMFGYLQSGNPTNDLMPA